MWRHIEAALSGLSANQLLSALCLYADDTSVALAQKTAAVDIAKDVDKLRCETCLCASDLNGTILILL